MKQFIFYIDPETRERHIKKHDVTIEEIDEAFNEKKCYSQKRKDKSYIGICKLSSGRCLEIIYRKNNRDLYFVITAYDIEDKNKIDFLDSKEQ